MPWIFWCCCLLLFCFLYFCTCMLSIIPVAFHSVIFIFLLCLQILALVCVFCGIMCVYETLEYALCYNDEKKEHRRKLKLAARARQLANETQPDSVNSDDITESSRLLQMEEIPMETVSVMVPTANSDNSENVPR